MDEASLTATSRALPKVLLHEHLDGGLRVGTLFELLRGAGIASPAPDVPSLAAWFDANAHAGSLTKYLEGFALTVAAMATPEAMARVAFEAAEDARTDGAVLAEFRIAPLLFEPHGVSADAAVEAMVAGLVRSSLPSGLIVCAMRHLPPDETVRAVELAIRFHGRGVVGFDLAGPEHGFPPSEHERALAMAREAGLPLTLHAGEADAAERVVEAGRLGARRIGHGVHLADALRDPARAHLVDEVRQMGLHLEVCPTSNVHTGAAASVASHPITALWRAGVSLSYHTDNRLMSCITQSSEAATLMRDTPLTASDLLSMALQAANASFLDAATRRAAESAIRLTPASRVWRLPNGLDEFGRAILFVGPSVPSGQSVPSASSGRVGPSSPSVRPLPSVPVTAAIAPTGVERLSAAQRQAYEQDGFLVLPGFKSEPELAAVRERAHAIVDAFQPDATTGIFSTRNQALTADAALIASADQVHCFFEEEAFDAEGRLQVPKSCAVNKIGHALHDRDDVFDAFSHGAALAALAVDLGIEQPQVWQSQVIFKQPGIGGEVRWHQDATFFATAPDSVVTFWFALEDAALDNGCLWVEPGGHRGPRGVLRERFVREADRLRLDIVDPSPWPSLDDAVPLVVTAGSLVVFHGLLPHCSAANRSPRSRLAYTLHVTDGRCAYSPGNWLQRRGVRSLC